MQLHLRMIGKVSYKVRRRFHAQTNAHVMAAGMGSRYGGFKQIDPVGPNGETIMDYSLYDAIKSGFGKVVFIIQSDMFRKTIGDRIRPFAETEYACQELAVALPAGFPLPARRKKPWGTAHAVLCCRELVKTPFAVINTDDFYGPASFQKISRFFRRCRRLSRAPSVTRWPVLSLKIR